MNKTIKSLLAVVILSSSLFTVTSCNKVIDVSNAEQLNKVKEGKSINITSDFTINTADEYFDTFSDNIPGINLTDMTLEGNGHTITVKGDISGKIGDEFVGFFTGISNSTINNLNIVYDVDVKVNGSNGSICGGLAKFVENSKINNVNITYLRDTQISYFTDRYGYHNSGFGGLAGWVKNSTLDNCKVEGKFYGTAGYIGGIAEYLYANSTMSNCVFDGGISTCYLEESYIGGLVGYCEGEIYSSKVELDYFTLVGQPQAWRARTSSGGGLVGSLKGNLHDCYLDFNDDGYYLAKSIREGTFQTTLNKGVLVGEALAGSKVKNVYVDGLKDDVCNIKYPDNGLTTSLGIGKNESTDVSNVFFVDDKFHYNYEETIQREKQIDDRLGYRVMIDEANNIYADLFKKYDEDVNNFVLDYALYNNNGVTQVLSNPSPSIYPNDAFVEFTCDAGDGLTNFLIVHFENNNGQLGELTGKVAYTLTDVANNKAIEITEYTNAYKTLSENTGHKYDVEFNNQKGTLYVYKKLDDGVYETDSFVLELNGISYDLSSHNFLTSGEQFYNDDINNYTYRVTVENNNITLMKQLHYCVEGNATLVETYEEVEFDLQEDVIGSTNEYWKYDSQTNKPLLKSID